MGGRGPPIPGEPLRSGRAPRNNEPGPLTALCTDGTTSFRLSGTHASSSTVRSGENLQLSYFGPCRIPFQKGGDEVESGDVMNKQNAPSGGGGEANRQVVIESVQDNQSSRALDI